MKGTFSELQREIVLNIEYTVDSKKKKKKSSKPLKDAQFAHVHHLPRLFNPMVKWGVKGSWGFLLSRLASLWSVIKSTQQDLLKQMLPIIKSTQQGSRVCPSTPEI